MNIKSFFWFLGLLLSAVSYSGDKQLLKVGVGNFAPFFNEAEDSGLFVDITKKIFEQLPQYEVEFVYLSNHRLLKEINRGRNLDVACNIFKSAKVKGYLSIPVFRYSDVAITKTADNIVINDISQLHNLSIGAYQGAADLLGEPFKSIVQNNPDYREYPHPRESTYVLLSGEKKVRVGDIHIFVHDLADARYQTEPSIQMEQFTIHKLWPDVYSHMAFKDESLRNKVNEVIGELNDTGELEKIYARYKLPSYE